MTEGNNKRNMFELLELNKANMLHYNSVNDLKTKPTTTTHKKSKSNGFLNFFESGDIDLSVINGSTSEEHTVKSSFNMDHFESERIEFFNMITSTKQNILQYNEEKEEKLKERYCWAIKENIKKINDLKDLSILKFKDLKAKKGFWKDVHNTDEILQIRKEEIKAMKVEFEALTEKTQKCLGN